MASAVLFERHPLERTVRWRTVANELSMGYFVRRPPNRARQQMADPFLQDAVRWQPYCVFTAYHSFGGEVEALNTPTICRLTPSCRHQLSALARVPRRLADLN